MTKAESEKKMPEFIDEWFEGVPVEEREHPSISDFRRWMVATGKGEYLKFRSVAGDKYDVEMWFDKRLGQMWRR